MNILISGDFVIADEYANNELIDQHVVDLFQQADFRIVNLEAPLTANEPKNKILKTGPHLRMSENTILSYLKQLKVNAVTLANNHILDYGAKGLNDTFELLDKNKINYVGAGSNLSEAAKHLTLEKEGLRIAILNFCENEWSIAKPDSSGANPLNIIDNTNQIRIAKATHDKVVCIIHGGHEYYHLPSPRMQKQYRFYADNGADAIVGHHTHCIGGYEIYNDVLIIYSLGNFLFTMTSKSECSYTGLVLQLQLKVHSPISFELFPVKQSTKSFFTTLIEKEEKHNIEQDILALNKIIADESTLKLKWEEFILLRSRSYLNYLSPVFGIKNRYIQFILNYFRFNRFLLTKNSLKFFLNLMRCESHADLTKEILSRKLNS